MGFGDLFVSQNPKDPEKQYWDWRSEKEFPNVVLMRISKYVFGLNLKKKHFSVIKQKEKEKGLKAN